MPRAGLETPVTLKTVETTAVEAPTGVTVGLDISVCIYGSRTTFLRVKFTVKSTRGSLPNRPAP